MALNFTNAVSDRVVVANHASIDNATTVTSFAWVYPTSFVSGRRISLKGTYSGGDYVKMFGVSGTSGDIAAEVGRVTANALRITTDQPLTQNAWNFVAMAYNEAGGIDVFVGDMSTPPTENTSGTDIVGTDATLADNTGTGTAMYIGNGNNLTSAFSGYIALFGYCPGVKLDATQLKAVWMTLLPVLSSSRLHINLGFNGTGTQTDWSGYRNNGTVTGATVINHVPIPFQFPLIQAYEAPTEKLPSGVFIPKYYQVPVRRLEL